MIDNHFFEQQAITFSSLNDSFMGHCKELESIEKKIRNPFVGQEKKERLIWRKKVISEIAIPKMRKKMTNLLF